MEENEIEKIIKEKEEINGKVYRRIKQLREQAASMIENYLLNNCPDKEMIFDEIYRISEIIRRVQIDIRENKSLNYTYGWNNGNKIVIEVTDIKEFISGGAQDVIITLIHELYHSISKTKFNDKKHFIEEGYVTEITAETIRYAIDNPVQVNGEKLIKVLNMRKWKSGYEAPSEFVRSMQVIMRHYGYNGMFEYMFSENGIERLIEIAQEINPEFADVIRKQCIKSPYLGNCTYEREFIRKMFANIDLNNISETDIEDNLLLQEYLINEGLINKNPQLAAMVRKYNSSYKLYKALNSQVTNLHREELLSTIKGEVEGFDFEYQTQENRKEDIRRMNEIINFEYEQSSINPRMFDTRIYFAKLIAYDFYQRGVKQPVNIESIKEYLQQSFQAPLDIEVLTEMVNSEIDRIYEQAPKGIKISSIINNTITNQTFMGILANKELGDVNSENFWKKAQNVANLALEQKEKNGENFYILFYNIILEMTEKYMSFNTDKIYNENDFYDFRNKMTAIFNKAGVPVELMNRVGLSIEKIYLKSISENVKDENKIEQTKILLECIRNNDMHFGKNTNDLQNFIFEIYEVYEVLKEHNNSSEINQFMFCILEAYYNKGLGESHSTKINEKKDPHIKQIIFDFALTPSFCSDENTAMRIFESYPDVYDSIRTNPEFYKKLVSYLPKKYQKKINLTNRMGMWGIYEIVMGTKSPKIEDFSEDKFKKINPIVKFYMEYDRYISMVGFGKTDEAKTLWNKFYGKREVENDNNIISKIVQEDKITEQIIKLMKTKNATVDQVRILACIYGVDIEGLLNYVEDQER